MGSVASLPAATDPAPASAADEREAALFFAELRDLVERGLVVIEETDEAVRFALPSPHGIAAALADIEAGRV